MQEDFEQRLRALRERYLENFPQDEIAQREQLEAFKSMTAREKEAKLEEALQLLHEKKALLTEKLEKITDVAQKTELEAHMTQLNVKIQHFEDKLILIQSGESDVARKERLKRQLTNLELKRCKFVLSGVQDQSKIDEKIAHKIEQYRKSFHL
jgi:hypothetical protein